MNSRELNMYAKGYAERRIVVSTLLLAGSVFLPPAALDQYRRFHDDATLTEESAIRKLKLSTLISVEPWHCYKPSEEAYKIVVELPDKTLARVLVSMYDNRMKIFRFGKLSVPFAGTLRRDRAPGWNTREARRTDA